MIIKNIILDLDGTIVLSARNIIYCFNYILKKNNYNKIIKFSVFKKLASTGSKNMFLNFFKNMKQKEISKVNSDFLNFYKKNISYRCRLRKYTINFLKYCASKKIQLFVSTNKSQKNAMLLLKKLKISNYFRFVAGYDTFSHSKPHKNHLKSLYNKFSISKNNTIFVGDSNVDAICAYRNETRFFLIKNGYTDVSHNKIKCYYKVDNFNQIITYLKKKE